tara:strand:+ start:12359 stop:13060 length:702 start_codon:yes stop_codon:yes gene_type:complete
MRLATYAFIFARGGSKGLKGKNLLPLSGVPLLAHSIRAAQKCSLISEVYVSTDDEKILNCAINYGAKVIHRPKQLALDDSPEWLAWQHAINFLSQEGVDFDRFISLPCTAPLRLNIDIVSALNMLDDSCDIVITASEASRNPWFNMIQLNSSGEARLVIDDNNFSRRQDAPVCYDMTTVAYVSRPSHILRSNGLWDGRVKASIVPRSRSLDIDTKFDLELGNAIFSSNPDLYE